MATFKLDTTPEQDALLAWIVDNFNKERDEHLTVGEFISLRFPQLLAPFEEAFKESQKQNVSNQFLKASPQVKDQVRALLGL